MMGLRRLVQLSFPDVFVLMGAVGMPPFPEFLLWFPQVLGTIVTMIATIVTGLSS